MLAFAVGFLGLVGTCRPVGSAPSPVPAPAAASAERRLVGEPTASPTEASNMTILNDGATHVIDNAVSFRGEVVVVTDGTTLVIKNGGYVEAPVNGYKLDTEWSAVRLSVGSVLNATGGSIVGSRATRADAHGGEAIEVFNGQSGPETASYAYFYDGVNVVGGDASDGVGGSALHVHGFGTEAFIYGGTFRGGKGFNDDDGLSMFVLNSAKAHIYSGSFEGTMEVGDSSEIAFYGCFMRNDTTVTGTFAADETYVEVDVRARDGGEVVLISVAEQECDTAPSMAPTNFPTLSPQPTVPRPNSGGQSGVSFMTVALVTAYSLYSLLTSFQSR